MNKNAKIAVFGSNGMVGKAITKKLYEYNFNNIQLVSRQDVDLLDQNEVSKYFRRNSIEYVFMCAGKVGGILANKENPASFGYENAQIALNVLEMSKQSYVKKLLYLGSSCVYPKNAPQPIKEEYLLSSELESTNELYALSKILGIKLCQAYRKQFGCNFISCMPCNLYGLNDNFNTETGHVLPSLIKKIHIAKQENKPVVCWGSGNVYREFMYVDDLAEACLFLMLSYNDETTINVGTGQDITIKGLVNTIKDIIGFTGEIKWDETKPDGTFRKVLDVSKINNLGWKTSTSLEDGIKKTYEWWLKQ